MNGSYYRERRDLTLAKRGRCSVLPISRNSRYNFLDGFASRFDRFRRTKSEGRLIRGENPSRANFGGEGRFVQEVEFVASGSSTTPKVFFDAVASVLPTAIFSDPKPSALRSRSEHSVAHFSAVNPVFSASNASRRCSRWLRWHDTNCADATATA